MDDNLVLSESGPVGVVMLSVDAPGSCRNGDACCIEMHEGPAGMAVPSDVDAPGSCWSGDAEHRF